LEEYNKILEGAAKLFYRIGIKSASMDDIARELAVSKKTIYKHFSDKKSLVTEVLNQSIEHEQKMCWHCFEDDSNAIQRMIDVSKFISKAHQDMNPALLFDLRKYYPSLWSKMDDYRNTFISDTIKTNIEEGQKEGMFREDIIPDIIAELYIRMIASFMDFLSTGKAPYDFKTIHKQMISYHLYGICSAKGQQYLEQHINEI
jgi:AcrR family transcriptional regulator